MAFITLTSGAEFEYNDIPNNFICIEDIAISLGRQSRFLGHGKFVISTAAHSINVGVMCEAVRPGCGIHGLLHDGHEAFLGDPPTPLKRSEYALREIYHKKADEIDARIYDSLGIRLPTAYERNIVRAADEWAGLCEGRALFRNYPNYETYQLPPDDQAKLNYPSMSSVVRSADSAAQDPWPCIINIYHEQNVSNYISIGSTVDHIRAIHDGQFTKSGEPFWTHPVAVMCLLPNEATEEERIAALLHDVVEDTSFGLEYLGSCGYTARTLWLVDRLTKRKGPNEPTYMNWIRGIADTKDKGLIGIKLADNTHNMLPSRLSKLPEKDREIVTRYQRSATILTDALHALSNP